MKQTELCSRCGHELHKHSPACYQCQQVGKTCAVFLRKLNEYQPSVTRSEIRERKPRQDARKALEDINKLKPEDFKKGE